MSMREFSKISPQIWINERGREIKALGIKAQLLSHYLNTSPHASMIGIYYLPITYIVHESNLNEEDVITTLKALSEINFCSYDEKSEYVWVHDFAFEQLGYDLKPADKRVKGIHQAFASLPKLPFLCDFLDKYSEAFHMTRVNETSINPLQGACKPLASKEKEKNNEKENDNEKIKKEKNINNIINFMGDEKQGDQPDDCDTTESETLTIEQQARNIIHFFNEIVKPKIPADEKFLNLILSHIKSGVAYEHFFHVITSKWRQWKDNAVMKEFLRIEVIFGKKFSKYLNELHKPRQVASP